MGQRQLELETPLAGQLSGAAAQSEPRWHRTDDLDVERAHSRRRERLDRRLLGRESRREVTAGTPPGVGVGELGGGEETLGEPWSALQRSLDPADLDQVDPDPAHSTVTVFARLRG